MYTNREFDFLLAGVVECFFSCLKGNVFKYEHDNKIMNPSKIRLNKIR